MATTTFTNGATLSDAAWFNDVDAVTYDGATTQVLVGGGAGVIAVWTTATGTGAPVRAGAPTFTSNITFSAASAKIIPGATSLLFQNNADSATNLSISDAGALVVRAGATFTTGNLVLSAGLINASSTGIHLLASSVSDDTLRITNSSAAPFGILLTHSTDTNGTSYFANYVGNATRRAAILTNGGLSNFQANDVNLSTRAVKNGYRVYTNDELLKYEAFLEDVDFGVWKYNDQTHDDWNHGPTVEGVQMALRKYGLADEESSLIDVFDAKNGLAGIVTHDLANLTEASLVASNKRNRQNISDLLAWKAKAEAAMAKSGITIQ